MGAAQKLYQGIKLPGEGEVVLSPTFEPTRPICHLKR